MPWDYGFTSGQHLSNDFMQDMQGFQLKGKRQQTLADLYKQAPVLFTIVRNDGQRCCALPCKWLSTFVCFSCCQDGVKIYAGPTPVNAESTCDLGRPFLSLISHCNRIYIYLFFVFLPVFIYNIIFNYIWY